VILEPLVQQVQLELKVFKVKPVLLELLVTQERKVNREYKV
tara:strand:- start:1416 stop:1538 length:123 start_codon:yes stop_codon:yes gene_type:complete